MTIPADTATFRESISPVIGSFTFKSVSSRAIFETPLASFPKMSRTGREISESHIVVFASRDVPIALILLLLKRFINSTGSTLSMRVVENTAPIVERRTFQGWYLRFRRKAED